MIKEVGAGPLRFEVIGETEATVVELELDAEEEFELAVILARVVLFEPLTPPFEVVADALSVAEAVSAAAVADGVVDPSRLCTRSPHLSAAAKLMQRQSNKITIIFDLIA